MNKLTSIVAAAILAIPFAGQTHAQKLTEQFIPIGESPGLSGSQTYIGRIQRFDAASGTLSLDANGKVHDVRITDDTRIWLDRSASKQTNLQGDPSDFQAGRRAEVSFVDPALRGTASWVKVETDN